MYLNVFKSQLDDVYYVEDHISQLAPLIPT